MSPLTSYISPVVGFGFEFSPIQLAVVLVVILLILFGGRIDEFIKSIRR